MTGLPNIVYNWSSVEALHVAVLTMNIAGLLIVALAIIWTARLARGFSKDLNLVAPAMMLLAAVLCLPTYVLGIKAGLRLRSFAVDKEDEPKPQQEQGENKEKEESRQDVEKNRILYLHVLMCLISGGVVAGATAVSILRSSIFRRKIRDGLIEAIGIYGIDMNAKIRVDAIQMKFQCCGSNGYTDWFRLPWMKFSQADFLVNADVSTLQTEQQSTFEDEDGDEDMNADAEENVSTSADVPFSCCSLNIPRPCIHQDILKSSMAYGYEPERGLTISTKGCRSEIVAYGRFLGYAIVAFLTLLFVYQSVLCLLSRFLQTAHRNAYYIGPRRASYYVWIIGKVMKAADDRQDTPVLVSSETDSMTRLDRIVTEESNAQLLRKICTNLTSVGGTSRSPTEASNSLPLRKRVPSVEKEHPNGKSEEPHLSMLSIFELGEGKTANSRTSETQDKEKTLTTELPRDPSKVVAPLPPPLPQSPRVFMNDDQEPMKTTNDDRNEQIETREYGYRWSYPKQRGEVAGAEVGANFYLTPPFKCCKTSFIYPNYYGTEDSGEMEYNVGTRRICETHSRVLSNFDPADAYDRFRGTLQDTLARREGKLLGDRNKKTRWRWGSFVEDSSPARTKRISRKFAFYRGTGNFPATIVPPRPPPPPPPPPPPLSSLRNPVLPSSPLKTTTIAERLGIAPWIRSGNECRDFSAGFRLPRPI